LAGWQTSPEETVNHLSVAGSGTSGKCALAAPDHARHANANNAERRRHFITVNSGKAIGAKNAASAVNKTSKTRNALPLTQAIIFFPPTPRFFYRTIASPLRQGP